MAIGRKQAGNNGKLLVFRIKNKDANDVPLVPNKFEISEKNAEGKWVARPKMEESVSGDIASMTFSEKEYEGAAYKIVKIKMDDEAEGESYLLDLRYTNLSRNLFNSLMGLKSLKGVNVNHYSKTSKTDGKEYANISLWQGDTMIRGKFALDKLPKPDEIKDKKNVVVKRDYSEVDNFFETELKAWWAAMKGTSAQPDQAPDADSTKDESVPF